MRTTLLAVAGLLGACTPAVPPRPTIDVPTWAQELADFRAKRLDLVGGPEGWVTLAGLLWIEPGTQLLGADSTVALRLPDGSAPALVGRIERIGDTITFVPAAGVALTADGAPVTGPRRLTDDAEGDRAPTVLDTGRLTIRLLRRGERFALRVKDREHPARADFRGIETYPNDTAFVVDAQLVPADSGTTLPVVNIFGAIDRRPMPGVLRFALGGQVHELKPVREPGHPGLYLMFADRTNGSETYGAGRYVDTDLPDADGRVRIDFNRAYTPPCAVTPFATCPLPPRGNRLPIAVRAGEQWRGRKTVPIPAGLDSLVDREPRPTASLRP